MASGPPSELVAAVNRAAKKYNVPAATLIGIWRIESGSTYPNPAVNGLGYGGLFGTTKWNASTQVQADYAASILRNLLDKYGSMSQALYHYSGGGYTSVPGTSGGWKTGPSGSSALQPSGSSGNVQTVPDAGGGGSPPPSPAAPSGPQITPPAPVLPPSSPLNSAPAGGVEMPGSQNYSMDQYVNPYSLWQQVGQSNLVSQETQLLMSNAALAAGSTG